MTVEIPDSFGNKPFHHVTSGLRRSLMHQDIVIMKPAGARGGRDGIWGGSVEYTKLVLVLILVLSYSPCHDISDNFPDTCRIPVTPSGVRVACEGTLIRSLAFDWSSPHILVVTGI